MDSAESTECILCYEQVQILCLGQCNHGPICHVCSYKMRVINKEDKCPVCKSEN